jgi:hypothetical protein
VLEVVFRKPGRIRILRGLRRRRENNIKMCLSVVKCSTEKFLTCDLLLKSICN